MLTPNMYIFIPEIQVEEIIYVDLNVHIFSKYTTDVCKIKFVICQR